MSELQKELNKKNPDFDKLEVLLLNKIFKDNTGNFKDGVKIQVAYGHVSTPSNTVGFELLDDQDQVSFLELSEIKKLVKGNS